MHKEPNLEEIKKLWHGSYRAYAIGFIGSLLLTSLSFYLVAGQAFAPQELIYAISALALVQAVLQLLFFLHVGQEGKPHWETWVFLFMLLILVIIVVGSLWVMNDLNSRMMPHNGHFMYHD